MHNRHVKFGLKIPQPFGENVRKFQGGGFDSHCIAYTLSKNIVKKLQSHYCRLPIEQVASVMCVCHSVFGMHFITSV